VRLLLAEHVVALSRQLARIAGRIEMTVRLRWQEEDTFRIFVERFPELRKRRDACFNGRREPGQMELLELGRTFEKLLQREREDKTSLALAVLGQVAVEVKTVEPTNERLMFDLNCLIDRDHESRFDSIVEELAGKLGEEFVMEVRGPWAPYNFVNVSL
jgi:Gas vesicle synthesis protein GvpL/GvpF